MSLQPLSHSFLRNLLLFVYVSCFAFGMTMWSNPTLDFDWDLVYHALAQGFLIGQVYFWLQTKYYRQIGLLHFLHWLQYPILFYIWSFQAVFDYLWFWTLMLLQLTLVLSYEQVLNWRRIPGLKNILLALMWFVQLNVIPGLAGDAHLIFPPFILFYLALSLQVDIEDIEEDRGKITTLAGLLGKETAGYLFIFLLTLFSFYIGLPWVWIMLTLIVLQREFRLPKGTYDSLLFLLGLYFILR